ncbi:glycoside hydrolase family 2 TIM barrel-domain containing protein [Trichococcus shcherbakoviae]|uniref:Glycoside hydrolase family 2 protein n=1 Tax=Trichococcus shcherbakoviae subsp. psychrophilus TaxID=2585775 RepID=A0A5C5E544_9LACT|nr:glycoside hydrolase family 2 TIM barrel-domain containing protein [Trichococcus shcherbakoviae]TNV68111.1 glycoside hydrolase family 2 protein [Trichococcus shcherbakoviae subsp. psychrophilus]
MIEKKFNDKWKFWENKDSFALVWNVPETAQEIAVPHDAMFEKNAHADSLNGGNTGYYDGAFYNYVKTLHAPADYKEKTVILKFEGVYMNAMVYINGELAGKNMFGYSTFYVPLNDFLRYGEENEIRVQVRNGAMTNSRWYSGGGIYRDVYLLVSDVTHLLPEGIQIKTTEADETLAVLDIATEVKTRKYAPSRVVLETVIRDAEGNEVAKARSPFVLFEQEERIIKQRVTVDSPDRWSDENPSLYTCESNLYVDGELADEAETTFGIRTLQVDAKRGLRVNGEIVKLRGACIHHDSGLLGAATYEDAQFRQIKLLKEAGFNAVRMSHHPMAPAMLRACDRLGMYVMDETFDMWNRMKSDYDYGLYFHEWWEKDVTAMVRKDFNHPAVILYSVGNEIPEIGTPHGSKVCHELCAKIKSLDDTRFTLAGINGVFAAGDKVDQIVGDVVSDLQQSGEIEGNVNDFMTLMDGHLDDIVVHPAISERLEMACSPTDIAGYNYMTARYEGDSQTYPNRIMVGSETYPPEIARNWDLVEKLPQVIGDFTWTGWDYLGEAGIGVAAYQWGEGGFGAKFPCQLAYVGDIDITGVRRPASYLREIVFGLRTNPYITVQNPRRYGEHLLKTPWIMSDNLSSWNWQGCEGKPVIIEVYAPGTEVELFRNGESVGKQASGKAVGYRVLFKTTYEPGTLEAVAFENGQEIGRISLKSAGEDCKFVFGAEEILDELIYVPVAYRDAAGTVAPDADQTIRVAVSGGAELIGFGSGNPKPESNPDKNVTQTFYGRAMIILKKTADAENIVLTITAENGVAESLELSLADMESDQQSLRVLESVKL